MKHKHVFGPEKYSMWQVTVFGVAVRSKDNFPSPEEAACSCQLFKHYLNSEFRLVLPESLDGEMFAALAYRRSVDLSSGVSVFSALTHSAKQFLDAHLAELEAYQEAHPESIADKFRRSGAMESPEVREWVNKLDAAGQDEEAYAAINSKSFFLRLSVVEKSVETALNSLGMALRMHGKPNNARLIERVRLLTELSNHLQATAEHIKILAAQFKTESDEVALALQTLENSRPTLT